MNSLSPSNAPQATGPASAAPARRRCVLVVDDESGILSALRRLLRREPYELATAANGDEALQVLEQRPVDVIVSDYRMPGMTGTDLLREIQQRWPQTVRIILSGYSEVNAIIGAINDGAVYKFITKPWNDESLKLNIRRAIEQFELEEENRRLTRETAAQNERLRELNELLDQRAADAAAGQNLTQKLHDVIDAGVVTLDPHGLVVAANRRAAEMLGSSVGLVGLPAELGLPRALVQAAFANGRPPAEPSRGRVAAGGRIIQWSGRPFVLEAHMTGYVLTLWEEVG